MTTVSSIKTATNNKNYTVFIRDMDGCRNCHVHIYGTALITKILFGEASLSNFVKVKVFIEQSKQYFQVFDATYYLYTRLRHPTASAGTFTQEF